MPNIRKGNLKLRWIANLLTKSLGEIIKIYMVNRMDWKM